MNSLRVLPFLVVITFSVSSHAQLDPRIQLSTYLGGTKVSCDVNGQPCSPIPAATTQGVAVATDAAGNIYVAGTTNTTDFPTTTGAYKRTPTILCDGPNCTSEDSFLAKFNSSGQLVFSTFLDANFQVYAMAVDASGSVYLAGDNNLDDVNFRQYQAFVYKFSSSGARVYVYNPDNSSGCQQEDTAFAITLDATGKNAYIAGFSNPGFGCVNTTAGAYQSKGNGFASGGMWAAKIDVSGASSAATVYATYIGPSTGVFVSGAAVDSSGNAYITGTLVNGLNPSTDGTFPVTSGAFQRTAGGGTFDAFVTKLNSTGTGLVYSTLLGGSGNDGALGVRVDSAGEAFVTGATLSGSSFPHTRTFGTDTSTAAFITKLNSAGSALAYSDLLYGANGTSIGIDSAGNAYDTGTTKSTHLPLVIPFQSTLRGAQNVFFANADTTGNLKTSSYLGGNGTDQANSIWVNSAWNAYIVGTTSSTNFPVTTNAYQNTLHGSQSAFVTKIIIDADLALTSSPSRNPVPHGTNLTYTYAVTNRGQDSSDGDQLQTSIPAGTTFVSFTTTAGTCSHPAVGATGSFICSRGSLLLSGNSWGPITLTVKVNAASGATVTNSAKVISKTQDVNTGNNSATVSVKVQ